MRRATKKLTTQVYEVRVEAGCIVRFTVRATSEEEAKKQAESLVNDNAIEIVDTTITNTYEDAGQKVDNE